MNLYGHPIAKELEAWWKDHAGRHDDPQWKSFIECYRSLCTVKYEELLTEHNNGGRFGMSKAGGCTRAAQLKALGYESDEFSGSTRATFFIGHTVEVMALATLIAVGYHVIDGQMPVAIDPFMLSAQDGAILLDGKRTLLSVKSSSYKKSGKEWRGKNGPQWVRRGFPELPFEGVRKSQPSHWAQLQAECYAGGYDQALILYVAKDMVKAMEGDPYMGPNGNGSLTFYAELVPANDAFVLSALKPAWSEAWENVGAGVVGRGLYIHKTENNYVEINPSNAAETKAATGLAWFVCDYCDLRSECTSALLQTQLRASIDVAKERTA